MGNIWCMSDSHLGHEKVARIRGFVSTADHDTTILRNLSVVQPGDTMYLLGDLVMGNQKEAWLHGLGKVFESVDVHVILGNHDRPHPCNRNAHQHSRLWYELFDSVSTSASIRYNGKTYLMSHFPYDGEGEGRVQEERHSQWRLRDMGTPLIHGHTHDKRHKSLSSQGTEQYHCGLDAWNLKPVNIHDLLG